MIQVEQNSYYSKSKTFGLSLGASGGKQAGSGSVNFGVNYSSSKTDRLWVDNQTSIIGTDSVLINTGNNTNIKGAVIANIANATSLRGAAGDVAIQYEGGEEIDGGNLNINTKTLIFSNLYDHEYSQSSGFGFSTNIGVGQSRSSSQTGSSTDLMIQSNSNLTELFANNTVGQGTASSSNPNQQNSFYPNGSTTISLNNSGYKKEQTTKATIGLGNITTGSTQVFDNSDSSSSTYGDLATSTGGTTNDITTLTNLNRGITNTQEITKDTITNALNITTTFDNRLLSSAGRAQMAQEFGNMPKNLVNEAKLYGEAAETIREVAEDNLGAVGTVLTAPTQVVEGTIFTFLEEKNSLEGSYLINKNGITTDPTQTKNYAVNGIITTNDTAFTNYISDPNNDVTLRYNPTHGFFGDLIESAIGKISNIIGTPQIVVMNNYVAEDLYQRSDLPNSTNTFHSQGSIIGTGAIQLYANTYQRGFNTNGEKLSGGAATINQTQQFVAVGPAVLESDWRGLVKTSLNLDPQNNADYSHNKNDPIRYLTAPSNVVTDIAGLFTDKPVSSPIYIPNLITNIPQGIWNAALHIEEHDVKNENYSKFLKGSQEQNSQNQSTTPLPNN